MCAASQASSTRRRFKLMHYREGRVAGRLRDRRSRLKSFEEGKTISDIVVGVLGPFLDSPTDSGQQNVLDTVPKKAFETFTADDGEVSIRQKPRDDLRGEARFKDDKPVKVEVGGEDVTGQVDAAIKSYGRRNIVIKDFSKTAQSKGKMGR